MSFNREADPSNDFLSFFKDRYKKSDDEEMKRRVATDSDPYAQVGSGKPQKVAFKNNYKLDPDEQEGSDAAESHIQVRRSVYRSTDPFAAVYEGLREHKGVAFGAQREDGTWEVAPLVSETPKITGSAFGSAATRKPVDESSAAFLSGLLKTIVPFS